MCKKTNDYYHHSLEYVPDCYMTQEMYKEVGTYPSALMHVSNCYETQKMCKKLLILVLLCYSVSLIAIKLKKCLK